MKNKLLVIILILFFFYLGFFLGVSFNTVNKYTLKNNIKKEVMYEILSEAKEGKIFFYNKIMKVIPRTDGGITLKEVNDGQ
ncbi:MAG TPA: hypothetical protein PKV92_09000 [Thermodesulfovibrio thiophilus]|nr:hypothetical protein [Thermodesulfovibrio thiophilus]HQD37215.1 hypothetical protein [Thermodesulfovibrio thiophilus]